MVRHIHKRDRQGVLILVVLSLLVLFVLVAVAFVISAGQHRTAARAASRQSLTGTPPRQLLDEALRQLLRGTEDAGSALHDNDLLGDMYDEPDTYAADDEPKLTADPVAVGGGQLLDLTVSTLANANPHHYSGRVLTFVSGAAEGTSTRIVSNPSTTSLRIIRPKGDLPSNGDQFLINGRPFDGTLGTDPNEDYDAADQHNLFLAALIPADGTNSLRVIPSFDRTQSGGTTQRPSQFGALDPATDSWDVDNDGDGIMDSIWIDVGFPAQSAPDGRLYKALVAILCTDLDGRLNLNAHGTLAHLQTLPTAQTLAGGASTSSMPRGEGYGPPEISLEPVLGNDYVTFLQGTANVPGRYGWNATITSRDAGEDGYYDDLARLRLFQYPLQFSSATLSAFGMPSNLKGNLALGVGTRGQLVYDGLDTDQLTDSAYEIDLSLGAATGVGGDPNGVGRDMPYSVAELEALLRPYDVDSGTLPDRLLSLASSTDLVAQRHKLTTLSYDLPIYTNNILASTSLTLTATPCPVAPEMLMGVKMDLNRPFGNGRDDNANNVIDEEEEAGATETVWGGSHAVSYTGYSGVAVDRDNNGVADAGPTNARQIYARQLYTLASLLGSSLQPQELAQWAINVVDFRDADSIMTKFDYDPNPVDGWSPTETVWGCERPELLITETLAFHDRRTEDLDTADTGGADPDTKTTDADPDKADDDYDQQKQPQSGFYIELYNPWPIGSLKPPGELYDAGGNGVLLGKTSATGGSPVWRVIVVRGGSKGVEKAVEHHDAAQQVNVNDIERCIYFATGGGVATGEITYRPTAVAGNLGPGKYAVIGTSGTTYFGERNDAGTGRRRIVLSNDATPVEVYNENAATSAIERDPAALPDTPVVVPIDGLSISEPTGSGEDPSYESYGVWDEANQVFNPPIDEPIDKTRSLDADLDLEALWSDDAAEGQGFRYVHLQRLANPLAAYEETANPYLTVDVQPVNLTAFNGSTSPDDKDGPGVTITDHNRFAAHQRGDGQTPADYNLWQRGESNLSDASIAGSGKHHFDYNLQHTLGFINDAYSATPATNNNIPDQPFPWLVWNNRPFVSQFELMQVPKVPAYQLTSVVNVPASNTAAFDHLLDFTASNELKELFDYVHVPSRFAGTQTWFHPQNFSAATSGPYPFRTPHNWISRFRDPGKINLNTIYSQDVWDGLMHNVVRTDTTLPTVISHPGPTWAEFVTSRRGYPVDGTTSTDIMLAGSGTSFFTQPFRSVSSGVQNSLLRDGPGTSAGPLFAGAASTSAHNDTTRNSYFRTQALQRLGNLVTTRSNCYAVWITLGYFEVDSAGTLKPGSGSGVELGSDTGTVRRHRGFYILDRTIPVGYEPGENHNVEDAVLLRTFIE